MKDSINKIVAAVIPFFIAGISIVLFIIGIIVLSYILLFGALLGIILFVIAYIYAKFGKHQTHFLFKHSSQSHIKGRVIDHDDQAHR